MPNSGLNLYEDNNSRFSNYSGPYEYQKVYIVIILALMEIKKVYIVDHLGLMALPQMIKNIIMAIHINIILVY